MTARATAPTPQRFRLGRLLRVERVRFSSAVDAAPAKPTRHTFTLTLFDGVSLGFAGLGVIWALALVFVVQPDYVKLFNDFGSALPFPTELALKPALAICTAAIISLIAISGVLLDLPRDARGIAMGVVILLTISAAAFFLYAMYLPIYHLAGAIK